MVLTRSRFELVVARLGPPKFPKRLENGLFWDKKWVKNAFGPFGVNKQVEAHFEPMLSNFGPSQGRKGLENRPIWDHKWLKSQKHFFWHSMWFKIIFEKKSLFCTRWTVLTHFGTHLFGLPLADCRSPPGPGMEV